MDSLTKIPDRSAFQHHVEQLISRPCDTASLALLDIDHFMDINNALGHDTGDDVLQKMASLLSEFAFESNSHFVYRISGDEFAIILPGTSLERAFLQMEQLRLHVMNSEHRFALSSEQLITVTIGVAHYPRDARDAASLVRAAEEALMTAKASGRNHVALAPNDEMVMKSCYYTSGSLRRLKALAERANRKESIMLREALDDLLRKYDQP